MIQEMASSSLGDQTLLTQGEVAEPRGATRSPTMSVYARDLGHARGSSLKGARGKHDPLTAEERLLAALILLRLCC